MTPNTRLLLIAGILIVSVVYAVLVVEDPSFASAIALGYVALLLTVMAAVNVWKKP